MIYDSYRKREKSRTKRIRMSDYMYGCSNYFWYGFGGGSILGICLSLSYTLARRFYHKKIDIASLEGGWDELSNSPKSGDDISL